MDRCRLISWYSCHRLCALLLLRSTTGFTQCLNEDLWTLGGNCGSVKAFCTRPDEQKAGGRVKSTLRVCCPSHWKPIDAFVVHTPTRVLMPTTITHSQPRLYYSHHLLERRSSATIAAAMAPANSFHKPLCANCQQPGNLVCISCRLVTVCGDQSS